MSQTRSQAVYLLPNLLTTCTVAAGFFAMTSAMQGHMSAAVHAVFLGLVTDGLDSRVARLMGAQRAFGGEYDSLADMCCFAMAPAVMVFQSHLQHMALGWSIAFVYVAATALRLARFNIDVEEAPKHYFKGLPCPSAAVLVAGSVSFLQGYDNGLAHGMAAFVTLLGGLLMVSSVPYPSFKDFQWEGKQRPITVIGMLLVLAMVALDPEKIITTVLAGYVVFGIGLCIYRWWKGRRCLKAVAQQSKKMVDQVS